MPYDRPPPCLCRPKPVSVPASALLAYNSTPVERVPKEKGPRSVYIPERIFRHRGTLSLLPATYCTTGMSQHVTKSTAITRRYSLVYVIGI